MWDSHFEKHPLQGASGNECMYTLVLQVRNDIAATWSLPALVVAVAAFIMFAVHVHPGAAGAHCHSCNRMALYL